MRTQGMVRRGALRLSLVMAVSAALVLSLVEGPIATAYVRPPFVETASLDAPSEAVKRIAAARDYFAEAEWTQGLDLLRGVLQDHDESLVRVSTGRYVTVREYVRWTIAELPPDGLAVYRRSADPRAKQLMSEWERTNDPTFLKKLVRETFASSHTDEALLALGDWHLAHGAVQRARRCFQQLIPMNLGDAATLSEERYAAVWRSCVPTPDVPSADVRARLIYCRLLEVEHGRAQDELRSFSRLHPLAEGRFAGRDDKLVDILHDVVEDSRSWDADWSTDWPTFAGSTSRDARADGVLDVGGVSWSVRLPVRPQPPVPAGRSRPPHLSVHPIVVDDTVFFCDAYHVYAYNLKDGQPKWPVTDDVASSDVPSGLLFPPDIRAPQPAATRPVVGLARFTLSAHENRLFVKLGSPIVGRSAKEIRPVEHSLVCLDLGDEGRLLWEVTPERLFPDRPGYLFAGAPVAHDDRVFVCVDQIHPQATYHLACLDAIDGELLWLTPLCSGVPRVDEDVNLVSHRLVSVSEDVAIVCTDTGAIAAIDCQSGSMRWLLTYASDRTTSETELNDDRKVGLTPCLISGSVVVAAPTDSQSIFAIDLATGVLLWERRLPNRIRHILGAHAGALVVSGDALWALDLWSGRTVWRQGFGERGAFGFGRGVMARDRVYWPLREEIVVVDVRSGQADRQPIPLGPRGLVGGNLVVVGERLIIAGPDRLSVLSSSPRQRPGGLPSILSAKEANR